MIIGLKPLLHPVPIVLIGTTIKDKVNYTTIGDVAIAGMNPALIMISLHANHFSTKGLLEHGLFSVNTPDTTMLNKVDYCGMVSGREVNKSSLFETLYIDKTPYIKDAVFSLICKVENSTQVEHRIIFVARVLKTIVRDDLYINNTIQYDNISTVLYGLNNKYYNTGQPIGIGYREGKNL